MGSRRESFYGVEAYIDGYFKSETYQNFSQQVVNATLTPRTAARIAADLAELGKTNKTIPASTTASYYATPTMSDAGVTAMAGVLKWLVRHGTSTMLSNARARFINEVSLGAASTLRVQPADVPDLFDNAIADPGSWSSLKEYVNSYIPGEFYHENTAFGYSIKQAAIERELKEPLTTSAHHLNELLDMDDAIFGGYVTQDTYSFRILFNGSQKGALNSLPGKAVIEMSKVYRVRRGKTWAAYDVPVKNVKEALRSLADQRKFDAGQEWAESIDIAACPPERDALKELASQVIDREKYSSDAAFDAACRLVRFFFIGSYARMACGPDVFEKQDMCLLFNGTESGKKSAFFGAMAPGNNTAARKDQLARREFWTDASVQLDATRFEEAILGYAWVELAELDQLNKHSIEMVKKILSTASVILDKKYAEFNDQMYRRTNFCGTTNKADVLTSGTGNRRFAPVHVRKTFPSEIMTDLYLPCWAQAKRAFEGAATCAACDARADGETRCPEHRWWLATSELDQHNDSVGEFLKGNQFSDKVAEWHETWAMNPGGARIKLDRAYRMADFFAELGVSESDANCKSPVWDAVRRSLEHAKWHTKKKFGYMWYIPPGVDEFQAILRTRTAEGKIDIKAVVSPEESKNYEPLPEAK